MNQFHAWHKQNLQRCGALEYNDGIVSDHCGRYVDLDAAALFGGATDDQVAASSRGFTSKNEKTKKYLDALDKYFIDHKICSQIDLFVEDAPNLTRTQLKRQYEGIDNDITRGMLASEQQVHPCWHFKFEWSPELAGQGRILSAILESAILGLQE
jgi:hypothetical protein